MTISNMLVHGSCTSLRHHHKKYYKHTFIDISMQNCKPLTLIPQVYREYRELLALDATTSRLFGKRVRFGTIYSMSSPAIAGI